MIEIKLTRDEIAIIYDALLTVEATTDVYWNPYNNENVEKYQKSFINTFEKISCCCKDDEEKGAMYFQ